MTEHSHERSRNPNVCASCSSLADGMAESVYEGEGPPAHVASNKAVQDPELQPLNEVFVEWVAGLGARRAPKPMPPRH